MPSSAFRSFMVEESVLKKSFVDFQLKNQLSL